MRIDLCPVNAMYDYCRVARSASPEEAAGQIEWSVKGLDLGSATHRGLREFCKALRANKATRAERKDVIEDLDFELTLPKRNTKKITSLKTLLSSAGLTELLQ